MARRPVMPGRPSERHAVRVRLRRAGLHSVCEEARCPNVSECFGAGTATFLILGDVCTRACRFCAVTSGSPPTKPDPGEPGRLAETVGVLGLSHVVITSVTRDDLPDGGAAQFAACIRSVRATCPQTTIEVLVPDFQGRPEDLALVLDAGPDVFNHNLETVPRLSAHVRPQASYERSLDLLTLARSTSPGVIKSGLMVGLGETDEEVESVLDQLAGLGCDVVTIGQYLQPSRQKLPVLREVPLDSFARYRRAGRALGLKVIAGPLVRSSWHAQQVLEELGPAGRRPP